MAHFDKHASQGCARFTRSRYGFSAISDTPVDVILSQFELHLNMKLVKLRDSFGKRWKWFGLFTELRMAAGNVCQHLKLTSAF